MDRDVEQFFSAVRSPVMVSDLITMLAAGVPLKAERVPLALLPCTILLATIGYRSYQQQIVDDYGRLLERFGEEWLSQPNRTHRDLDHPQLYYVVHIVEQGHRRNTLWTYYQSWGTASRFMSGWSIRNWTVCFRRR